MAKTVQLDANGYRKFGMRDKLAYAAGDFGCNMSFALKGTMTIFWTQFMGINSVTMATLLLLVQIWDAINDPLIGSIIDADKHQYKRNKFLTYIWFGSCGLLVAGAACFLPLRGLPNMVKCILFIAGYILWDAFYTIANVPYGSMLSLITKDAVERAQLSTFRSVGSMGGNIVTMVALPFLIYDASNNLKGETVFWIALLMGGIGFLCFQFMIKNTVVRVEQNVTLSEEPQKFNVFKAFGNFMRNRAAVGATLAPMGQFIGMYAGTTASTVLFQSYFQNVQISGLLSMLSMMGMFIWMPLVTPVVKKFGKKEAATAGLLLYCLSFLVCLILPITPDGKGLALWAAVQVVAALGSGILTCISWSLMADAMDYEEWKFGTRNEGTTYALHSFFRKLAQGIGPSIGLVLIAMLGYDESLKAAQTMETAMRLRYYVPACNLFAGVMQIIGIGLIFPLTKGKLAEMQADLAARKAAK